METEKDIQEDTKNAKIKDNVKSKEVKKFKLKKLEENCRELYGVSKSTFIGATCNLQTNTVYSVDEIRDVIDKWHKKGAK